MFSSVNGSNLFYIIAIGILLLTLLSQHTDGKNENKENKRKRHRPKLIPVGGRSSNASDTNPDTFIFWGDQAHRGNNPHMASLQFYIDNYNYEEQQSLWDWELSQCVDTWTQFSPGWFHICGGALISTDMVLTAAHCVDDWIEGHGTLDNMRVGLGWWDLSDGDGGIGHQVRGVRNYAVHPDWDWDPYWYHVDLALLHLDSHVDVTEYVSPITIRNQWIRKKGECHVAGWGETQCGWPNILQELPQDVLRRPECKELYRIYGDAMDDWYPIFKSEVCTLSWNNGTKDGDTCYGDSGSVLVCGGKALGVVSWGDFECQGCRPAVFAHIGYAQNWIRRTKKTLRETPKWN